MLFFLEKEKERICSHRPHIFGVSVAFFGVKNGRVGDIWLRMNEREILLKDGRGREILLKDGSGREIL